MKAINRVENKFILNNDYCEILIVGGKRDGLRFKIDLEDVERCKKFKWYTLVSTNKKTYTITYLISKKPDCILLHRFIMGATGDEVVDHINGDTLDNRKCNLRVVTVQQNVMNHKHHNSRTKSGHRGVFWYHAHGFNKWVAKIQKDGKRIHIGYFDELQDAIDARLKAEEEYFGEFARQVKST